MKPRRLAKWYDKLRPVEKYVAPNQSQKIQDNIRTVFIMLVALPGLIFVESVFVTREWRSFEGVAVPLPSPIGALRPGDPWPVGLPSILLSDVLPNDIAAALPSGAAVPQGQSKLTVFSIKESVLSLNTPVHQSWFHSVVNPDGDAVTTEVFLWCGYDLETTPARPLCLATVPIPIFGRVVSGACLSHKGFALHQTLLSSDICEAANPPSLCDQLPEWNANPPGIDQIVEVDENLQCAASVVLPHMILSMTMDQIVMQTQTISSFVDSFSVSPEHGPGFTRSLVSVTHTATETDAVPWPALEMPKGVIPITISSQARAAGLFWTAYDSRYAIQRGDDAKAPARSANFLGEYDVQLRAPTMFEAAAVFLGRGPSNTNLSDILEPIYTLPVLANGCTQQVTQPSYGVTSTVQTELVVRIAEKACSELAITPTLIEHHGWR